MVEKQCIGYLQQNIVHLTIVLINRIESEYCTNYRMKWKVDIQTTVSKSKVH